MSSENELSELKNQVKILTQALSQRNNTLSALKGIGDIVNNNINLSEVFNLTAQSAQQLIQAETVLIPILNADQSEYEYRGGGGHNVSEIIGESLSVNYGICGWVLRNKKPWWQGVLDDLDTEDRNKWEREVSTVIVVPLISKKGFLGGIAGLNKQGGQDFTKSDLDLLTLFASQVSTALENVNLTHDLNYEINERKTAEKHLAKAMETAKTANMAKTQFLARMSHELRTPLNAIVGYSEILQEDICVDGRSKYLPDLLAVTNASQTMLSLVDDILDISHAEAKKLTLHDTAVYLSELRDNLINEYHKAAELKKLQFTFPNAVRRQLS